MLWNILAYCVIAMAFAIAVYKLIKFFVNPLRKCNDCSKECSCCELGQLKKDIEAKKNQQK